MSLVKVLQPWLKQYLSDHLLDPTVELLVKQLEVYKEINIAQTKNFLNQYVGNNSYQVFKQLASELEKYVPADAVIPLTEADIKKKKKELKQLLRQSSRSCEDVKVEQNSFSSEGDVYCDELSSNLLGSLFPQFPFDSIPQEIPPFTQENARQMSASSTLQVKPLHKLIKEPLLTNGSSIHPVSSNDLRTSEINGNESKNSDNDVSVVTNVRERKKHKKRKKSQEWEHGLGSYSSDKEPTLNHDETVNNFSSGCDENLTVSTPNPVINRSNEQVPDNLSSNPDCLTDMFLKLLDFVKSLSEGHKKKITEDIFRAISTSIKENCAPTVGSEESAVYSNVCKTKSKKKKRDKSRDNEEVPPKEIIFLDITEDQDDEPIVERSKKRKNKKRDKRKEREENQSMESSHEVTDVVPMDTAEDTACEGTGSSKKKKKKKRHREASCSNASELEDVVHNELNEDVIPEYYEEPPKKKKKKKKSKHNDLVEEEMTVPEPFIVPQISEVVGGGFLNERRRSLSGSCNEGEKTSQENTTSSTNISPSKNSSHSNSFKPMLYDYENLISESVISKQPINPAFNDSRGLSEFSQNQRSGRPRRDSGMEPSSNHPMASSSSRPNPEESSRSSPCKTASSGEQPPQVIEFSPLPNERARINPFPSFELNSYDSSRDSDSSVEIIDHISEKVKTEPLSPTVDNIPINTQESVSSKKSRSKPSKNSAPRVIPSEVSGPLELDDKDILHEVVNIPDLRGNEVQHDVTSRIEVSSDTKQPGGSEVTLSNSEMALERFVENGAETTQQNQYRSLEKELLELEQCLYLADKADGPERPKSNAAVSKESVDDVNPSCSTSGPIPNPSTTENHDEPERSNSGSGTKAGEQKFECYKCGLKFAARRQLCEHWIKHVKEKLYDVNINKAPVRGNKSDSYDANRNLPDLCPDSSMNEEQPPKQPSPDSGDFIRIVDVEEIKNQTFNSPHIQKLSTPSSSKIEQQSTIAPQQIKKQHVNSLKTKQQSAVGSPQIKKQFCFNSSKSKLKSTSNSSRVKKQSTTNSSKTKTKQQMTVSSNTPSSLLKCLVCLTTFKDSALYAKHMKKHAKPFKCSLCNACFKTDDGLKRHLIIHSSKKPFKCPKCTTAFKRRGDLNFHLASVHFVKRFSCQLCQTTFRFRRNLLAHTKEMHQQPPSTSQ